MTNLGVFRGNNAADVRSFETWLGKPVDAVLAYTGNDDWGSCDPGWQVGSTTYLGGTGRRLRWSIPAWPKNNSLAEMRSVAAGNQFSRHQGWARTCLNARSGDGDPIYVRTTWELGGEWFWWSNDAQADPAAFKNAVNKFYEAFKSVSPRFRTQFDVVPDRPNFGVENYYPGDQWIDLITQDVYWHPQYDGNDAVAAFARHDTGLSRGLAWIKQFAAARGKGVAIPEWGVPGQNGNTLDGAAFIRLMRDWMRDNKAEYADYWDSTSAYDGLLSDNNPSGTAAELKKLFLEGVGTSTGGTTPPPPPPPTGGTGDATVGTGADRLVLRVTQDKQGTENAKFTVKVNGAQVGGTLEAVAARGSGAVTTITVQGDWPAGTHSCAVTFLNDAGGVPGNDRNFYVEGAAYNGAAVPNSAGQLLGNGTFTFPFTEAAAPPPPPPPPPAPTDPFPPTSLTVGTGPDTLALSIAQDHHQESARYTVAIDGVQIGGTLTASALKSSGQSDTVGVKTGLAAGWHSCRVVFVNDAYAGEGQDRNLYVLGARLNGAVVNTGLPDEGWVPDWGGVEFWFEKV